MTLKPSTPEQRPPVHPPVPNLLVSSFVLGGCIGITKTQFPDTVMLRVASAVRQQRKYTHWLRFFQVCHIHSVRMLKPSEDESGPSSPIRCEFTKDCHGVLTVLSDIRPAGHIDLPQIWHRVLLSCLCVRGVPPITTRLASPL